MNSSRYSHPERETIDNAAADWLVAHDRGLNLDEEIEFARWLSMKTEHAKAWQEAQSAWGRLDELAHLPVETIMRGHDWKIVPKKEDSAADGSPARRGLWRAYWPWAAGVAAALALAPAAFLWTRNVAPVLPESSVAQVVTIKPRHLVLPDGSQVDLNAGSEISEEFTRAERHVRLLRGEAHFTVMHDATRPFVVDASGVMVRAVGTAFNVRLNPTAVEVLVTEGTVRLEEERAGAVIPRVTEQIATDGSFLDAGRRAIISLAQNDFSAAQISTVSKEEIQRELAWQGVSLKFADTSLDRVAAEFNRLNATQLLVENDARDVTVTGTFRADNAAVFVNFLEHGFGITAERRADNSIVLRKTR